MIQAGYVIDSKGNVVGYKLETGGNEVKFEKIGAFIKAVNEELSKLSENKLNLADDIELWDKCIERLDKIGRRLVEIDTIYQVESDRILKEARDNDFDFKKVYGANNKDTRKQYVDEQMTDLLEEKQELEFEKADRNRRISFLKRLIDIKIELIKYDGGDIQYVFPKK